MNLFLAVMAMVTSRFCYYTAVFSDDFDIHISAVEQRKAKIPLHTFFLQMILNIDED